VNVGQWRLDPAITFLNHGSFGSCPAPVLEAQAAWREEMEARPIQFLWRDLESRLDAVRLELGAFLHADPEGLAFVPNATTGVNTVLASLRFSPGDELLTTNHEYNATINAMRFTAARDGAAAVIAEVPFPIDDPAQVVERVLGAVTPRTRIALLSHVTSPTGIVFPIGEVVRELEARGIATIVDAAHAPGMVPVDVDALGASYWTGNAHKWLCAPKGSAVLHVRDDKRAEIHPLVISHGMNERRTERTRFRAEFDWIGTIDPSPYLCIPAALRFCESLMPGGWPELMDANRALTQRGRHLLCERLDTTPAAPDSMIGSLAAVAIPLPLDDDEIERFQGRVAEQDRIEVPIYGWPVPSAREGGRGGRPHSAWVRISMQRYNELDDVERLAGALERRLARA
jgi:isopenicillin-N epimerase